MKEEPNQETNHRSRGPLGDGSAECLNAGGNVLIIMLMIPIFHFTSYMFETEKNSPDERLTWFPVCS